MLYNELVITPADLQAAFYQAEVETAAMFGGATCSMLAVTGETTCPICYFTAQTKRLLAQKIPPRPDVSSVIEELDSRGGLHADAAALLRETLRAEAEWAAKITST